MKENKTEDPYAFFPSPPNDLRMEIEQCLELKEPKSTLKKHSSTNTIKNEVRKHFLKTLKLKKTKQKKEPFK